MKSMRIHIVQPLLIGLAFAGSARTLAAPSLTVKKSSVVGKITAVRGQVTLKRRNLKRAVRVSRNFQLCQGDKVYVGKASRATMVCFVSLQSLPLRIGPTTVNCQRESPVSSFTDPFNRSREITPVATGPDGFPIFRPRGGKPEDWLGDIIHSRPAVWGTSVSLTKVITSEERNQLATKINALRISKDEKQILLADLDAMRGDAKSTSGRDSYRSAIKRLQSVSNAASDPFIQLTLGDLYLALGDATAEDFYRTAIKVAQARNDLMGEAYARHALAMVREGQETPVKPTSQLADAIQAYTRAIELYAAIGEDETAKLLQQRLSSLQQQQSSVVSSR
jgi:hypothetical protein